MRPTARLAGQFGPWSPDQRSAARVARPAPYPLNALWIFSGTEYPDLPIQNEAIIADVGCLHPKAKDEYDNKLFMIGENDIYIVTPSGEVKSRLGEDNAMREAIFERGANWVEDQATYNVPLLCIDRAAKLIYVYTQKGKLWFFSILSKEWTKYVFAHAGGTNEVADMIFWNNKVWFSLSTNGVGYLDSTYTVDDTGAATTADVEMYYDLPVMDLVGPKRDLLVETIDLHHQITAASQTATIKISRDGGNTYPQSNQVDLTQSPASTVTKTDRIDIWQTSDSLRVRIYKASQCTRSYFTLTGCELAVQVLSEDDNMESPVTGVSSNL